MPVRAGLDGFSLAAVAREIAVQRGEIAVDRREAGRQVAPAVIEARLVGVEPV